MKDIRTTKLSQFDSRQTYSFSTGGSIQANDVHSLNQSCLALPGRLLQKCSAQWVRKGLHSCTHAFSALAAPSRRRTEQQDGDKGALQSREEPSASGNITEWERWSKRETRHHQVSHVPVDFKPTGIVFTAF